MGRGDLPRLRRGQQVSPQSRLALPEVVVRRDPAAAAQASTLRPPPHAIRTGPGRTPTRFAGVRHPCRAHRSSYRTPTTPGRPHQSGVTASSSVARGLVAYSTNARLRGIAAKIPASDPPAPSSQCSDSDSYTQKCRIEINTSSGCRATVTTRNPCSTSFAANAGSRRQWICSTTSGGRAAQSASVIACRARCGTWYAVPSRWRTQVFPARGVLTTAIRNGASIAACGVQGRRTYITHLSPAGGDSCPGSGPRPLPRPSSWPPGRWFSWPPARGAPPLVPTDLPAAERQLVEFLLLLPVAALVCCVVRNVDRPAHLRDVRAGPARPVIPRGRVRRSACSSWSWSCRSAGCSAAGWPG